MEEIKSTSNQPIWYRRWISQCRLLLWKNWRVALRNRRATIVQLVAPVFFIFSLWLFEVSIRETASYGDFYDIVRSSEKIAIDSIPLCVVGPRMESCYTFIYSPTNSWEVDQVVEKISRNNFPPIPESSVRGFSSPSEIDDFLFANMNTTQGVYLFSFNESQNSTIRSMKYAIQVNETDNYSHGQVIRHQTRITIPMQLAVERAILEFVAENASLPKPTWDVSLLNFPHLAVASINIIGQNGPIWFFASLIVNFVIALGQIVSEKELKLRESMKIMGLYDSVYWFSWFITLSIFNTCTVLCLIIFGCIFQFTFFLRNNFFLYFWLMELFGLTLVPLSFMLSTLVKKANQATTLGFAMFFLGYFLQTGAAIVFQSDASGIVRALFAIVSPSVLRLGLFNLGEATENDGLGLEWKDVNSTDNTAITSITFAGMYGWLIADFFIYLAIALYLDNILPNEYGTRKPYYYFLTKTYWKGTQEVKNRSTDKNFTTDKDIKSFDEDVLMEEDNIINNKMSSNTAVVIKNLSKVYQRSRGFCKTGEPFVAVKDLCLSIEEDTLLCLLGPNGAGKTTTMHMLVGFHPCSFGDATIFGYSIRDSMSNIQSIMGLCPQFDILWNDLTGEEHLRLFAGLKNLPVEDIDKEVKRLLKEVDLVEEGNMRTASYSGGMRRRLSVAISLIGNPKIVILDEPTTGMDPISRREVWNVIENAKKNRVIILTTHSMEEADVLSDRIAIVAGGRLRCLGSSLHLKQKYGAGYRITVGTLENKVEEVRKFFESNLKGSKLTAPPLSGYMNFAISSESTNDIASFFQLLQDNTPQLGIHDCQLSITTLEEVFLTIAENAELAKLLKDDDPDFIEEEKEDNNKDEVVVIENEPTLKQSNTKEFSLKDQFHALFVKTAILQWREKRTNLCQVLTPFVFVTILFLFDILINSLRDTFPTPENRYPDLVDPFHMLTLPPEWKDKTFFEGNNPILSNLETQGTQLFYAYSDNIDTSLFGSYSDQSGLLGSVEPQYGEPVNTKFFAFTITPLTSNIFSRRNAEIPFHFRRFESKSEMDNEIFSSHRLSPYIPAAYYFETLDFTTNVFRWSAICNYSLTVGEDAPFIINRMTNAISQNLQGNPVKIELQGIKSMPTAKSDGFQYDIVSIGGTLTYWLILHQLLPVFMSNIVAEKELKIRELMKMTGLKMSIYWIVHYIFDYLMYLFISACLICAGYIWQVRFFTINSFGSYYFLILIWGHVLIALSFLLSIFFDNRRTATVVGYVSIIAVGLCSFVLIENLLSDVDNVSPSTRIVVSLFPPLALYRAMLYLVLEVINEGPGFRISEIGADVVDIESVYYYLIVEWFIIMVLWLYLEQVVPTQFGIKKHPLFFLGYGKKHKDTPIENKENRSLPDDVEAEIKQVSNDDNKDQYSVRVFNLKKTYPSIDGNPPKEALRGVTFGVKTNTCQGILGHNGAGKTTLLNTLIGLYPPTDGSAYIGGFDLTDELSMIHTLMGVCTQYDILWDTLTGKEHLLFYGRIRNLKGDDLNEQVDLILKKFNLWDARNQIAGSYSGGMKRRLSVAISILAIPPIIYLDEPSTGLDPKSRRKMWQVINEAKQYSSLVLTTHSMEEADAICDRLMIMADGEIKCIGVSADLKNRFGEGFKLSVQVAKGKDEEAVHNFVLQLSPNATLVNKLSGNRNYQVPKNEVTLDKVFHAMESEKDKLHITDWAITNPTLEEVFQRISSIHHHHESPPQVEEILDKENNLSTELHTMKDV